MRHSDNELVYSTKNLDGIFRASPHSLLEEIITQQFDQTFVKSRIGLISESQGTVNGMELRPRVKGKYFDNQGQEIWQNNAKIANNSLSASPQTKKTLDIRNISP